jgi:hypothetical protein
LKLLLGERKRWNPGQGEFSGIVVAMNAFKIASPRQFLLCLRLRQRI